MKVEQDKDITPQELAADYTQAARDMIAMQRGIANQRGDRRLQRICDRILEALTPAAPADGLAREQYAAEIVHDAMMLAAGWGGEPRKWIGGNSLAEDEARRYAIRILDLTASEAQPAQPALREQAVMVCPQCEGAGGYADGLDEAACHEDCPRCGTNGWIVDLAALSTPERQCCVECNGTGIAEKIGGYERPCDACHGKGTRLSATVEVGEMVLGLRQVAYVLKSVANGDDQSQVAGKCASIVEQTVERIERLSVSDTEAMRLLREAVMRGIKEPSGGDYRSADDFHDALLDYDDFMHRIDTLTNAAQDKDTT
jgi:hypothetical protein